MMKDIELGTRYDPAEIEDRTYAFWEEGGFFHPEPEEPGDAYTIVIPPPNVTGLLHIGHALNNTLQDIFIRWRRMQGFNTLWVPGTDHAGIATQNVVEQQLAQEGLHRWDVGREDFIERVWDWKDQYGDRITNQLRRLGASLDWNRERFTMDEGLSEAVLETFLQLYNRGLIYRGKYIINWCPRCGTALADDEVEHEEHEGHFWHIHYPFKDDPKKFITVATTRPETMLGDTAVAVHPDDERYKDLVGKTVIVPMRGREIPVIADDWVDPDFGTGAVKVTPAHDPDDFKLGDRHNLGKPVVIGEDGNMTLEAGERYEGMDRYECREALIEDLRERQQLEKVVPHTHSVGHCYRCHAVIEPYLSDQWFVKMKPLAKKAIKAAEEGQVEFHPDRWKSFYLDWLENVRDWCISRQIWWGHRLPVYYCDNCEEPVVGREAPNECPECGCEEFHQDEDVLDTWFSSALWPFSTLGWPEETEDLKRYYPTSTLITDRGIIYFWVARMVMMGMEFMDEVPFSDVLIHGTILDEQGRKMSKSLGNGIDPIEMIEQYGADAVR
ncbi:MAG: valine--tRNA ligase, partial [Planctomycetes bacterium]|nr:valine--tRNA ligase [Planctomycetota bacterium]